VYFFSSHRKTEHDSRLVVFGRGFLQHRRIHFGKFVGLTVDRILQVIQRALDFVQRFEVTSRVDQFRLRGGFEEFSDIGQTICYSFFGISSVLLKSLALAGKGSF